MIQDVSALVRRDHDDLDLALAAMVDTRTPPDELALLVDVCRLALAVHVSAQATVMRALIHTLGEPAVLCTLVAEARREHGGQQVALDRLASLPAGSDGWYARALELRVDVLDHAARAELARWTLQDHVPRGLRRALAADYATERLRVLARTSPVALAKAQLGVG